MSSAEDKGLGIKEWLAGPKSKRRIVERKSERATLDRHRIAVLPFANISVDSKDEYFADGLTEEMISKLSVIAGLEVIARTSVMNYKNQKKRVSDIGRELAAGSLIEGSVRKAGDRVRISVQLVNAEDEARVWGQNYDRSLDDIFAVQSDIATRVARALRVKLMARGHGIVRGIAPNVEAYTLYLKGRYLWNQRGSERTIRDAIDYFRRSVEVDPSFALGFSGLADCYFSVATFYSENRASNFNKARNLATKALEIDGSLAEAHATLAGVLWRLDYNLKDGERELRKAIELKPSYAWAHGQYAILLLFQLKTKSAYKEIVRLVELDPQSLLAYVGLGMYYAALRKYDKAIEQFRKALLAAPDSQMARVLLLRMYCLNQLYDEALNLKPASNLAQPTPEEGRLGLAYAYATMGKVEEARNLILTLEGGGSYLQQQPFMVAAIHFLAHESDKGFEWLERAIDQRDPAVILFLSNAEEFDTARSDSRYHNLAKKVNLE